MDPIKLQAILNKKPGTVVTADEWNEVLTLLVSQANLFSDKLAAFQKKLQELIDGKLENVDITANVSSFGGKPPEAYTLDTELEAAINKVLSYTEQALSNKLNKPFLKSNKILKSDSGGFIVSTDINPDYLTGITSNIQTQLNDRYKKSDTVANANNAIKVNNKNIFIQQTQPTGQAVGDIWISW